MDRIRRIRNPVSGLSASSVGIVTVRPGRRTAPKPAVQWTVRRRYGGAESFMTPDGTGRWTGRPSTVDGRLPYHCGEDKCQIAVNRLMRPRCALKTSRL
ncbi:hypothetical protein K438DRAFT_453013 [Mycena galopus ATCC 62051]|nr:hypothetical protein K438DRAFT_453013 [Mycena galopus ATCC 62051]